MNHSSTIETVVRELDKIIEDDGLRADESREYVDRAFRDGAIQMGGTAITHVLPPALTLLAGRWPWRNQAAHEAWGHFRTIFGLSSGGQE